VRAALAALAVLAVLAAVVAAGPSPAAADETRAGPARADASAPVDLLRLDPALDYPAWLAATGWADRRMFSDSSRRFRIEDGTLRLESAGDSYLIGRALEPAERRSIAAWPYLRFVVRIADLPRGARLIGEEQDDAAFRIYATFRDRPPLALVYVWSWDLPVGEWSVRGRSWWGDFRDVHRKAFGRGEPLADTWLTVEVHLRADFQARFPGQPLPALGGLALKADSNHTPGGRSLAWLRAASLHRTSLRDEGLREGDRLEDTVVWFR
jgi:hypothetical protein